ncbi:hypothetical protein BCR34DRAFT_246153 [Clohesyomyces aquaticus]|uniref:Uncharacterized protein n=1 Tax=Clohesyomyces aquaticus TaxID=1231657 RepID=A0A1Y1ZV11_9PLEO|nr:hypothetical protein BCR34DRAFT_246153 [Clohesyomyces aquaticus]
MGTMSRVEIGLGLAGSALDRGPLIAASWESVGAERLHSELTPSKAWSSLLIFDHGRIRLPGEGFSAVGFWILQICQPTMDRGLYQVGIHQTTDRWTSSSCRTLARNPRRDKLHNCRTAHQQSTLVPPMVCACLLPCAPRGRGVQLSGIMFRSACRGSRRTPQPSGFRQRFPAALLHLDLLSDSQALARSQTFSSSE